MFWKKQQNLSSFLREKTWVLATTHFGKSRCAFFFALHKSLMWTSLRNILHFETIIVATFRRFVVRFVESILSCCALRISCCVGYHRIFNKNNGNHKNIDNGNDNDKKGSNSFLKNVPRISFLF